MREKRASCSGATRLLVIFFGLSFLMILYFTIYGVE